MASKKNKIHFGWPMVGDDEKESVMAALEKPRLTDGPLVKEFEERFVEFTEGGIAVAVSSCMAALHICCLAYLEPDDWVIVPALTHPATAHAVRAVGAHPLFADVDPETGNITAEEIDRLATKFNNVKAVMVVHYLGLIADMNEIRAVARRCNLKIIEDCALALGARRNQIHAGLHGDAGCFSFYPVKHLTTGEGGMLLTRDPKLAQVARNFRAFGLGRNFGLNYRMSELHAALGLPQLGKAEHYRQRREVYWKTLEKQLGGKFEYIHSNGVCPAYYAFTMIVPDGIDRDELKKKLWARMETSVYYSPPLHQHEFYVREYGLQSEEDPLVLPNAERIAGRGLTISCGPHLSRQNVLDQIKMVKAEIEKCT